MVPNHILILGTPHSGKLRIVKFLVPSEELEVGDESHSGIIIKSSLRTKYYEVDLKIFVDEYPEERRGDISGDMKLQLLESWYSEFCQDEMKELRDAFEGLIFTINVDSTTEEVEQSLEFLTKVTDVLKGTSDCWDGFILVVTAADDINVSTNLKIEEIEDLSIAAGFEFINFSQSGRNEYRETIGKDRLKEVLETHEWSNMDFTDNIHYEKNKIQKLNNMTERLLQNDGVEPQMNDLSDILRKVHGAKEHAEKLNDSQKKDYATKIVDDIMNYI